MFGVSAPPCRHSCAASTRTCIADAPARRRVLVPHVFRSPHRSPSGMPCRQHVGTWFPPLKQTLMYGSVISTVSSQLKFTFPPQRACEWARSPQITGPCGNGADRDGIPASDPALPLAALIGLLGTGRPEYRVAHLTQRDRPVTSAGLLQVARGTGAVVRSRPAEKWSRRSALTGRHRAILGSSAWRGEGMEPRTGKPLSRTGGVCQ